MRKLIYITHLLRELGMPVVCEPSCNSEYFKVQCMVQKCSTTFCIFFGKMAFFCRSTDMNRAINMKITNRTGCLIDLKLKIDLGEN